MTLAAELARLDEIGQDEVQGGELQRTSGTGLAPVQTAKEIWQ
jgi:hypothetical protein